MPSASSPESALAAESIWSLQWDVGSDFTIAISWRAQVLLAIGSLVST